MQQLIQVHEHSKLYVSKKFTQTHFDALSVFHERNKIKYFNLGHKCIHFKQFVGVIQVNSLCIEVLPKFDKEEKNESQQFLIEMMHQAGLLNVSAPTQAKLKWKTNSILDLYIRLFLNQLSELMQKGLIKKYRKQEDNITSMKGKLKFSENITRNLIHKERFYCEYTVYNKDHSLHSILRQCLQFLNKYNGATKYRGEINRLLFDFPDCETIKINQAAFDKIVWNRKNLPYKEAILSAQMLLLNYHPDVRSGTKDVLAILFDMNRLFEAWVLKSLKRKLANKELSVSGQTSKRFWATKHNGNRSIRPDIKIQTKEETIILDTKWKIPTDYSPAIGDLHQMHSYTHLFNANQAYLLYPGSKTQKQSCGKFKDSSDNSCGVLSIQLIKDNKLNIEFPSSLYTILNT